MAKIIRQQEIEIQSQAGREVCTRIIDLVHIKLGNKAFAELVEVPMEGLTDFWWKYLHFAIDPTASFLAELGKLEEILKDLPDHPDIRVFQS